MSLAQIAAAGPGDGKNKHGKSSSRQGKLNVDEPPTAPRYVTLPDGREIWRPNAPSIPDIPGEKP